MDLGRDCEVMAEVPDFGLEAPSGWALAGEASDCFVGTD